MSAMRLSLFHVVLLVTVCSAQEKPQPRVDARVDSKIVTYLHELTLKPQGAVQSFFLVVQLPMTIEGRQKLLDVRYSVRPQAELKKGDNLYAMFAGTNFTTPIKLTIEADVEIYRYDLETARKRKGPATDLTPEERKRYLASEKFLEKDDPSIQAASLQITTGGDLETVRAIQEFIQSKMRYSGPSPGDKGAVGALAAGQGKCAEFSDLFVALCRAKEIPARTCEGFVTTPPKPGDTSTHRWAEVFLKDLGWVPFDPLHIARRANTFEHSWNKYIYCARLARVDPVLGRNMDGGLSTGNSFHIDRAFAVAGEIAIPRGPSDSPAYRPAMVTDLDKAAELAAAAKSGKPRKQKNVPKQQPIANDETSAARKLTMAKELAENGKVESARKRLQEIVDRYPNTDAAKEAREILDKDRR
jgi:hypothetical protein